jgi:hypothetical protein
MNPLRNLRLTGASAVRHREDRRTAKLNALTINQGVVGIDEPGSLLVARYVTDDMLHELLGRNISIAARTTVEREIRRRETVPTFRIAVIAIVLSVASLGVSFYK